ncbi:MAG: hypothetical protein WBQ04_01860 [Candidatus Acidiferrales bacterium]
MLSVNNALRTAIREGGRNDEIRGLARRNGMRLMHEYALERVKEGTTTLDEVLRVVPIEYSAPVNCESCQRELARTYAFCPNCGERAHAREMATLPELQGVEKGW